MTDGLKIFVLGSPILQIEERPLTADLISLKGQALLIYLAVTGQPHSRSALAGLLWGDLPEESARANLRLTLTRLRKFLPETILHTTRVNVALANTWLDAAEFDQRLEIRDGRLAESPISNLQSPFALYRADFLTGFDIPNAPEFETWVVGVRERLRQTAVTHLYHLVETAVYTQQAQSGIQAARQLLAIEPWHEEAHRQLMLLLAADGQRSAALAQYETCRRLLEEELGAQPSGETTALYQEILNDKVTSWHSDKASPAPSLTPSPLHPFTLSPPHLVTPSPPHNLPPHFTPFIGRHHELEKLTGLLQNGRSRLITLLGEGGVGKTRLALAAAEQLLPHFTDGIWFVPLAGLENIDEAHTTDPENSVASAIAAVLALNFAAGDPPRQQLASYLRQRQMLLILDNFEPLLDAAGLVLALLAQAPHLTMLATSREPLRLQAEQIVRVEGLAVPEGEDWETAVASDSLQLFAERAERATGQNLLTPENLPLLSHLCHFVNGLPLGIELIADWTRWLSLSAIAADLQTNLLHMERAQQDVPERHRSLQAVFNYSWQMLTPEEQTTLAQLSVFRGSFQMDGMRAVTSAAPATLFALIDKSLVRYHHGDFYSLHELLRVFAQRQRAALGLDADALRDRHARHYLARLAQRTNNFFGPEPVQALHQTQAENENLARAWQWAAERPLPDDLLPAVPGMGAYWNYAGLFLEADDALRSAISRVAPVAANGRLLAALQVEHAAILYELTRLDEMKHAAETAVSWSQSAGDEPLEANGRLRLGQYLWRNGRLPEAETELRQAEELAQKLGLINLEGSICRSLAVNAWRQADLAAAQQLGERSARLHQQANDVRNLYRSHYFLAILASEQQQLAAAHTYLEPIVDKARQLGDRLLEMGAIGLLGHIASYEGQHELALELLNRRQQLAEESGRLWELASTLSNLGDVWLRLGQWSEATATYQEALAIFQQTGSRQGQSNVLAHMGLLAALQGGFENGRMYCEEALQLAQEENAQREIAFARLFLAPNLLGLQQWPAALEVYRLAADAWEKWGDAPRQIEALAGQVWVLLAMDRVAEAKTAAAPLLSHLQTNNLSGANDPVRIYLTCHNLLAYEDAAQAEKWLLRGKAWLDQRAAAISDPAMRQTYLSDIPSHRELQDLFKKQGTNAAILNLD
ncbi:MAG: tetratricopeptide repeat protein [Anaerolineaceae bacterium]|nr:tetratricopeptide repeat protein [Anaerolineaceae bacterium]